MPVKISLVTATFNSGSTILDARKSVLKQSYPHVEHLIVDGLSTDNTLDLIREINQTNLIIDSRQDDGIYDALNRGVRLATGDVVGFLHSDDYFPDESVLECVANGFENQSADICYGDLAYVSKLDTNRVVRRWRAGDFSRSKLRFGWMPPHPTVYVRREMLLEHPFNLDYHISADYDAMLRLLANDRHKVFYLRKELVHMRLGGASNKSVRNILAKTREDWEVINSNAIGGALTLASKNLRKIPQFLFTKK